MALETENNKIDGDKRGKVTKKEKGEGKAHLTLIEETSQAKDSVSLVIDEIRRGTEKSRQDLEQFTDWAISQDRRSLKPLIADLLVKFVTKATAVLNQTNHILVPSSTRENSFRVATPAEVAASIPEAMYKEWGFPERCYPFVCQKYTKFVDLKTHRSYPDDRYALANILCPDGLWANSPERELLEPMFVFVYEIGFEEMASRDSGSIMDDIESLGVAKVEQNPWSPKGVKRPWREPPQRRRRVGGRSSRGPRS